MTTCPLCHVPKPDDEFATTRSRCRDCCSQDSAITKKYTGDKDLKNLIVYASIFTWHNKINGLNGWPVDPKYRLYLRRYGTMVQGFVNEILEKAGPMVEVENV